MGLPKGYDKWSDEEREMYLKFFDPRLKPLSCDLSSFWSNTTIKETQKLRSENNGEVPSIKEYMEEQERELYTFEEKLRGEVGCLLKAFAVLFFYDSENFNEDLEDRIDEFVERILPVLLNDLNRDVEKINED